MMVVLLPLLKDPRMISTGNNDIGYEISKGGRKTKDDRKEEKTAKSKKPQAPS